MQQNLSNGITNTIDSPGNGSEYLTGAPFTMNSPQNNGNGRRIDLPVGMAMNNKKGSLNNHRNQARGGGGLVIDVPDEKRCNLEDDESFEEQKGHAAGRQYATPGATRKSSINATPKSRVIEPGKIFSSRYMTPSAHARGRMGSLGITNTGQSSSKNMNHKHTLSNLIAPKDAIQGNLDKSRPSNTTTNKSIMNSAENKSKSRLNNLVSSLIKYN